jgi:hypothetical protein
MLLTATRTNAPGEPRRGRDASLAAALLSGGDERIAADPVSGRNLYGLTARPAPDETYFSSSTASAITPRGWHAAATAWRRLHSDDARERLGFAAWFDDIRRRVAAFAGAGEAVLTGSGTDAEFLALAIADDATARPITNIVVGPGETGRGVALAAAGLHFQSCALHRRLAGWEDHDIAVETVEIRGADGFARSSAEVDAEVLAKAEAALTKGRAVIAHLLDVSKTGLSGFSRAAALELRARAPEKVFVLADCCQMRGPPSHIGDLLGCGFMVAITGSKFFCGPPFCGALLLPEALRVRLKHFRLPEGLAAQTALYDWPAFMRAGSEGFGGHANIGLGLRWEAALAEMEAFHAIPPALGEKIAQDFRALVVERAREAGLNALDEPGEGPVWARTIVSVAARHSDGAPISADQAAELQRALRRPAGAWGNAARILHVGQPVTVGADQALRVCLGAPTVSDIAALCASGVPFQRALSPLAGDLSALFAKWRFLVNARP